MATIVILNTIVPMFVIIMIGVMLQRRKLIADDAIVTLNKFINNIFFPTLLFGAMAKQHIATILNLPFILAFVLTLAVTYAITYYYFAKMDNNKPLINTMRAFAASCPNCAYIGIPLLSAIFGPPGLIPAAITSVLTIFMMAAVFVMIEKNEGKMISVGSLIKQTCQHIIKNPLIIGSLLGIVYALLATVFHFSYPDLFNNFTTMLGHATIPCALLSIGMVLADKKIGHYLEVSKISFIKLIISPLFAIFFAKLFHLDKVFGISLILLCALPAAVIDYIIADEYHIYVSESSAIILMTTLVSVVTIIIFNIIGVQLW